jgi:hypothetical protein
LVTRDFTPEAKKDIAASWPGQQACGVGNQRAGERLGCRQIDEKIPSKDEIKAWKR